MKKKSKKSLLKKRKKIKREKFLTQEEMIKLFQKEALKKEALEIEAFTKTVEKIDRGKTKVDVFSKKYYIVLIKDEEEIFSNYELLYIELANFFFEAIKKHYKKTKGKVAFFSLYFIILYANKVKITPEREKRKLTKYFQFFLCSEIFSVEAAVEKNETIRKVLIKIMNAVVPEREDEYIDFAALKKASIYVRGKRAKRAFIYEKRVKSVKGKAKSKKAKVRGVRR